MGEQENLQRQSVRAIKELLARAERSLPTVAAALKVLYGCAPHLRELKGCRGEGDAHYIKACSSVAVMCVRMCGHGLARLTGSPAGSDAVRMAWRLFLNLERLDVSGEFREGDLQRFGEYVCECARVYKVDIMDIQGDLDMSTDCQGYYRCLTYAERVSFVAEHEQAPYGQAQNDLESIAREAYPQSPTVESLFEYLEVYSQSPMADKAVDELAQLLLKKLYREEDYVRFLERFGEHPRRERLSELAETACFQACRTQGELREYLTRYPQGRHSRQALDTLRWAEECRRRNGE